MFWVCLCCFASCEAASAVDEQAAVADETTAEQTDGCADDFSFLQIPEGDECYLHLSARLKDICEPMQDLLFNPGRTRARLFDTLINRIGMVRKPKKFYFSFEPPPIAASREWSLFPIYVLANGEDGLRPIQLAIAERTFGTNTSLSLVEEDDVFSDKPAYYLKLRVRNPVRPCAVTLKPVTPRLPAKDTIEYLFIHSYLVLFKELVGQMRTLCGANSYEIL